MYESILPQWAAETPDAPAIITQTTVYSFSRFAADIRRAANFLAGHDIAQGSRLLSAVTSPYHQWLLTWACCELGIVSLSVSVSQPLTEADLSLCRADVIVSELRPDAEPNRRFIHADAEFWRRLYAASDQSPPTRSVGPDDPVRIILSSGTTGLPKKVLLTGRMIDERLAAYRARTQRERRGGILSDISPSSIGGIGAAMAAWDVGRPVLFRDRELGWLQALEHFSPGSLMLAPFHLQGMLNELPTDFQRRPELIVAIVGGTPSRLLVEETRRRLTDQILLSYGSTEVGGAAGGLIDMVRSGEESAGLVTQGVDLQIVDDAGAPVAEDVIGEVRIRSPGMALGYADGEPNEPWFRDGWFYPGDLGSLDEQGVLHVAGRKDDLMTFGGFKILPAKLEAIALLCHGVKDAAAFAMIDAHGLQTPCMAYVADDPFDDNELMVSMLMVLRRDITLLRIDVIPRNAMGKIERLSLRRRAEQADAASAQPRGRTAPAGVQAASARSRTG